MLLCKSGISFKNSLILIKNKQNKKIIQGINQQLDDGLSIAFIFNNYLSKNYNYYFQAFILFLPFDQALNISIKLTKFKQQLSKQLIKKLMYPIILAIGLIISSFIFNYLCLPYMLALLSSFKIELTTINFLKVFLIIIQVIAIVVLFMIIIFFSLLKNNQFKLKIYRFICQLNPRNIFKKIYSLKFSTIFLACENNGLKTKEIIDLIYSLSNDKITQGIVHTIDLSFKKGIAVDQVMNLCVLDDELYRYFKLALYTNDVEKLLTSYNEVINQKIVNHLHYLSLFIQIICYLVISIIIICIYQMLMLPLNIIGQI